MRASTYTFLLSRHGEICQMTQKVLGEYDPTTSTYVGDTESTVELLVHPANFMRGAQDNTDIQEGDMRYMLSSTDTDGAPIVKPTTGDTIEGFGKTMSVQGVQEFYSKGTLLYFCHMRG